MAKVLVLYYSSYGHTEVLAEAVRDGAAEVPGVETDLRTVPELVPRSVAESSGYKAPSAPTLEPAQLAEYDGLVFGTPTRFGNMCSQMRNFLDQTGALWMNGSLIGKVGGAFCSTASQHGGQETTLTSFHTTLLHLGMVVTGVPYSAQEMTRMDEITGGTPYGATTIVGSDHKRMPSEGEQAIARAQGRHLAGVTVKLHG